MFDCRFSVEGTPQEEDGANGSGEEDSSTQLSDDEGGTVLAPSPRTSAMPEGWRPPLGAVPKVPITKVHSLGDLHGWAPGLITYLIENQLATIEVDGLALYKKSKHGRFEINVSNLSTVFPEPVLHFQKTGTFPPAGLKGQWLDFDGQTTKSDGHYSVRAEWVCQDPETAFVQVGDVFDRSDHSELACEILRQLIIQAPLRVFVLVGNHEQFFLENDERVWLHNEKRWEYNERERGLDSHGFQTRTVTEKSDRVFFLYSCCASLLYLTQGAILKYSEKGSEVEDWILQGGFEAASSAYKDISSKKMGEKIDGAIVSLLLGHTIFAHAEPNALMNDNADTLLYRLKDGRLSIGKTHLAFDEYEVGNSIQNSLHSDLLWSRGAEAGITDPTPNPFRAIESMKKAISFFPGLRHYVHGHSPVVNSRLQPERTSNPVSYLARRMEAPNHEVGSVRIHMIDSGICPVYHYGEEGIFGPSRVPAGLALTGELLTFHNPEDEKVESADSDSELWLVNHSAAAATETFTIPPSLTALKPTKIGSLDKGGVRFSMTDPWNDEGDRFQMEDGTLLIPSVGGMGKDNLLEFVICNGEVNFARGLRSVDGERIEMDRAVLNPVPIDNKMTGGIDQVDSRLSFDDPNQWFEVLPMLRVRIRFCRGTLLLEARSSIEEDLYLHISSLTKSGFSEIVKIPSRTDFKRKISYAKGEASSKQPWFVGLGSSRIETLGAIASGWSGDFVYDVAGLRQVLSSEIGDVFRLVLKTNTLARAPKSKNWEESESIIGKVEEATILGEPDRHEKNELAAEAAANKAAADARHKEATDKLNKATDKLKKSERKLLKDRERSSVSEEKKEEIPFKKKTSQSTSASRSLPIKKSKTRHNQPTRKTRSSGGSRYKPPQGHVSWRDRERQKQTKAKGRDEQKQKSIVGKMADKAMGLAEEAIDAFVPEVKKVEPTKEETEMKKISEEGISSDVEIRVVCHRPETKSAVEIFTKFFRLNSNRPDRIPRTQIQHKYFQQRWYENLELEFDDKFIDKSPLPFDKAALKVKKRTMPPNCQESATPSRLTIKNNSNGEELVFVITYMIQGKECQFDVKSVEKWYYA